MDYDSVTTFIRNRQYYPAADYIVNSILKEKIHKLSQQKRRDITIRVAIRIKNKRNELRRCYSDALKPIEIAERVYLEVMKELKPSAYTDHRSLSEIEEDEQ